MPSLTPVVDQAKPQDAQQLNKEGYAQPWKEFIQSGSDGLEKRGGDFITIRSTKDADGKEVHDYTSQLG
ncbi:hypothetical protein F4824DRAFT_495477 [Ustulina deusta]|nr:hypothetical protein F4824DRAFT_495477 [Ustulina deusta]